MLDLKSALPVENRITQTGLNGFMLGTKIQLLQNDGIIPEAALQADFELPVGNKILRTDKIEPKLRLNFKNKLSQALSLHYNLGLEWEENLNPADNKEYSHIGLYTLALQYKINPDLVVYGETSGEFQKKDMRQSLNTGLAYKIASNLQLDAYTGVGLSEEAPDMFISAGLTVRLPK